MQLEIRDQIADPEKWQQVEIQLIKMQEHGGIDLSAPELDFPLGLNSCRAQDRRISSPTARIPQGSGCCVPKNRSLAAGFDSADRRTGVPQCTIPACSIACSSAFCSCCVSGPLRVDQVSRGISAKRRTWRDARVIDEIARDRPDLGVADADRPEQRGGIVSRRRGLKKSCSQLPVRQSESRNDEGHQRRSERRCSKFNGDTEAPRMRQRQQRHAGDLENSEYQEAEK